MLIDLLIVLIVEFLLQHVGWELPEYEFVDEGRGKHTCRVEYVD